MGQITKGKGRDEFWKKECSTKVKNQVLYITNPKLARLVWLALKQRGPRNLKSEVVVNRFIAEYFSLALNEVIDNPVAHHLDTTNLSHFQVIEKESERGYDFDREFDGKDYEVILHHLYPYTTVTIDPKYREKVLDKVRAGQKYLTSVVTPKKEIRKWT